MSARKETFKQNKQKDRDTIKSLIQNVRNHLPNQIISEEHLQNPTPEFVKSFYIRFYSEYEQVTSEVRKNIMGENYTSDQNIYDDEISLTRNLNRVCQSLGISFNLNDLCEPQPKRTFTYFCILMNVLILLKSNTKYINEIEECVEMKNRQNQLKENKARVLEELGNLNELHVQLEHTLMDSDREIQNLAEEHKNIMMQKAEKDFEHEQDIKIINKLKEVILAADEHLNKLREESSSVLEQIVSEHEVEKLKEKIDDIKKQFSDLNVDFNNLVASLNVQEEKTNFHYKCLASVENPLFSSENLDCLKHQNEKLTTLNNQVDKIDEIIKSKRNELINLKEDYSNLGNNLKKLEKEFNECNIDCERESVKLRDDFNMLVSRIKKDEEIFRTYESENQNFEGVISSLRVEIATANNHFSNLYKKHIEKEEKLLNTFHEALLNIKNSQSKLSLLRLNKYYQLSRHSKMFTNVFFIH